MSIFQRTGAAAIKHLEQQRFLDERRKAVDNGWAVYIQTVLQRDDDGLADTYRYGFEELNKQTDAFVRREAARWAKSCRKYRIYEDDFESWFRYIVLKAALSYDGQKGTFFDYLRGAIKNAGRDLIRNANLKKNRINHLALNFDEPKVQQELLKRRQSKSAESEALLKITIEAMSQEPTLTDQERKLFQYLRTSPDATLQEMADYLGVRDRKQASRIIHRLAAKLKKHL